MTNLASLDLDNTQVSDAGLLHLKGLSKLQTLNTSTTKVMPVGLQAFKDAQAALDPISPIRKLGGEAEYKERAAGRPVARAYLSGSRVADADLSLLKKFPKLQHLDLGSTKIGDAGLAHLGGLANLSRLDLDGTQIGDAGLAHLKGMTNGKHRCLVHDLSHGLYRASAARMSAGSPLLKIESMRDLTLISLSTDGTLRRWSRTTGCRATSWSRLPFRVLRSRLRDTSLQIHVLPPQSEQRADPPASHVGCHDIPRHQSAAGYGWSEGNRACSQAPYTFAKSFDPVFFAWNNARRMLYEQFALIQEKAAVKAVGKDRYGFHDCGGLSPP